MNPHKPLANVNPGKKGPPGFTTKLIKSAAAPVKNPAKGPKIIPESIRGRLAKFILSAGIPAKGIYTSNITFKTKLMDMKSPALTMVRDVNFCGSVLLLIFSSLLSKAIPPHNIGAT